MSGSNPAATLLKVIPNSISEEKLTIFIFLGQSPAIHLEHFLLLPSPVAQRETMAQP
jgi:hypothetical protein